MNSKLRAKNMESLSAVVPITAIVLALCVTIIPMPLSTIMLFLTGAVLLIFGMGLFTLGAEMAMMPIGEKVGAKLTKSNNFAVIAFACFIIGVIITIAEPDLQVLAKQTPGVPDFTLIICVAVGVGIFLALAFAKTLFGWDLGKVLIICYSIIFILAFFVPEGFLAVAFDSGGVTTGPMTVPFIMSLGMGLSAVGKSEKNGDDTFGLVALSSIGPIVSVMILGLLYQSESGSYTPFSIPDIQDTKDLWNAFGSAIPHYALEVVKAILPIVVFFIIFQIFFIKMKKRNVVKIIIGLVYTLVGLTLFLTGVNVGFMPVGNYLGNELAKLEHNFIIVPLAMLIGYFIVKAEPAVLVLNKQVEEITDGAVSQKMMMTGLSVGMAISLGLSMVRIITGWSIMWFLIPGYALALGLSFIVPKIFTSIAFDSGGVASGPMTATFLLPFAMGACEALGGNILTDAFGIVAMVAMTPLITIQILGLSFKLKAAKIQYKEEIKAVCGEGEIINFIVTEEDRV